MECNAEIFELTVSSVCMSWVWTWISQPAWRSPNVWRKFFHTFCGMLISAMVHLQKEALIRMLPLIGGGVEPQRHREFRDFPDSKPANHLMSGKSTLTKLD